MMHTDLLKELSLLLEENWLTYKESDRERERTNEKAIFKNCVPFTDCKSEIHNAQVDNAKNLDVVKRMYNLAKYNDKNI